MKVKKRVLALALIMLASMFGGCASGGDSSSGSQTGSETSEASQAQTTKNGHFYYDPPITLNLAIAIGPEVKFKEGQDINNNEYNDWMLDEFGLDVNYVWNTPTSDDAFYTKLMLSISAGEPLPDFFSIENSHAHELIDSGLLMPIDDLWEQYAGDVWKTAYEDVADCWLPYKRDGQTYAYPIADYLYEHEDVMWIRDDWLEAVGMEAPTNLDELRAVMEAFVNLDSSVTGNDEVYAVAAQLKGNYITWMGLNCIFGMFGMVPEMWLENADGEIVYSSTQPEVKEALAELKDWLDKGYLEPEVGLVDEMGAAELFTSGRAGIAFGPTWIYSWPLADVEGNFPDAKVSPYPLPVGPDGTLIQHGNPNHYRTVLFSKDAENPQAFFEFTNFCFENMTDPDPDSPYAWGFKEGYDYVMKDGLPSHLEEDMPDGIVASLFPFASYNVPKQKVEIATFLASGAEPERPIEIVQSISMDENFIKAAPIVLEQQDTVRYDLYTAAPTELMTEKMADIVRVQEETFSKILYGKVGIDEGFDSWLEFWNNNGGPEITEEVREWYAAAGGE